MATTKKSSAAKKAADIISKNKDKAKPRVPVAAPRTPKPAATRPTAAVPAAKTGAPELDNVIAAMTGMAGYDNEHRMHIRSELVKQVHGGHIATDVKYDKLHAYITDALEIQEGEENFEDE